MKMVKCIKVVNHFYDGDKYDSCPHCLKLEGKTPNSFKGEYKIRCRSYDYYGKKCTEYIDIYVY